MASLSRISVNGFALALGPSVYAIDAESERRRFRRKKNELDQGYTRLYGVTGLASGLQG